jgi:glucokinase
LSLSKPIILTLDAGGTNFVFSSLQNGGIISDTVCLPASTKSEASCTATIIEGFETLKHSIKQPIAAISFAFPGPADYKNGIIGNLPNFPGINGNYPLKFILEEHFKCPCFINNDGNLFAYGEALEGVLPEINTVLKAAGSPKKFSNLIGITLGTGIGCGLVINGTLLTGDNSSGAEVHNMSNLYNPNCNIEESVSSRAIQRVYAEKLNIELDLNIMPSHIYEIAHGNIGKHKEAALYSFNQYGKALGFVLADVLNLIDGLVVIGGGVSAAWDLFAPAMFKAIQTKHKLVNGNTTNRTTVQVFNIENEQGKQSFLKGTVKEIQISVNNTIVYDTMSRTAVISSINRASKSISIGAYHFAISQLNYQNYN